MRDKLSIMIILFIPAIIVNLVLSIYLPLFLIPRDLWISDPNKAFQEFMVLMYTYGMILWPIMQVIYGSYAYFSLRRKGRSVDDVFGYTVFSDNIFKNIIIILVLVMVAEALFMLEGIIYMIANGLTYEEYTLEFIEIISKVPFILRWLTFIIGPFTAGIFEELFYRAYSISELEEKGFRNSTANLIQAIAFGLWHGISMHAFFTFAIGLIFGYTYYRDKNRTLLPMIIAHIVIDIIGFRVYITI